MMRRLHLAALHFAINLVYFLGQVALGCVAMFYIGCLFLAFAGPFILAYLCLRGL